MEDLELNCTMDPMDVISFTPNDVEEFSIASLSVDRGGGEVGVYVELSRWDAEVLRDWLSELLGG